jgi:DNA-directed RNA polymerase specialized sigma24 family protein
VERRVRARLGSGEPTSRTDPDPAGAVAVRAALQKLRPAQRRVLVLRYFLEYTQDETAAVLGMPVGTVKTHAARGLALLRSELGTSVTAKEEVTSA